MKTLYESDGGGGFDGGLGYPPNPSDFEQPSCRGCLWNAIKLVIIFIRTHQHDENALPLWEYFRSVIDWVESTFTKPRKPMKGVDWGSLYNDFKDADLDAGDIERETADLMLDEDVTRQAGIYRYILTREEKELNIRAFSDGIKQRVYEKQAGVCAMCKDEFTIKEMEGDHRTPWSEGGKTDEDNCQMLCRKCNREKSAQ